MYIETTLPCLGYITTKNKNTYEDRVAKLDHHSNKMKGKKNNAKNRRHITDSQPEKIRISL